MRSVRCFLLMLTAAASHPSGTPPQTASSAYDQLPDPRQVTLLRALSVGSGRACLTAEEGRYLFDLIVKNRLRSGLEISVFNGYSTIWLAMAFRRTGGRMAACAGSKETAREAWDNLGKAALRDVVSFRQGDAIEEIGRTTGPFDFIFLDATASAYQGYLEPLLTKLAPGGILAAHDVSSQSRDASEFLRSITANRLLQTELVPLSAAGMSITRKLLRK